MLNSISDFRIKIGSRFFIERVFRYPRAGESGPDPGTPVPPPDFEKTESLRVCFQDGTGNLIIFPV